MTDEDPNESDEPSERLAHHVGYQASLASSRAIAEWMAKHPPSEKKPKKGHGKKPEPRFGED